jgi:pyruvate dehydrogenase E2 component (dihydrolipoamide acetyltransferase)
MARWEFNLPEIGEGVTEGEVVRWLVTAGDQVREDQPIVEIMTDKATVTLAAPRAGTVLETHGKVGQVIRVHSLLVVFDLGGVPLLEPARSIPHDHYFNEHPLATPATRKTARDLGIDLRNVPPTGPQGRVTRADVEAFLGPTKETQATTALVPLPPSAPPALEERIPLAGLRRRIATKMARSTQTAAHFTFVEECDVTALKALRERLKPIAESQGVKLSFLPFFVKACVAALKKHPMLNSMLDEETQEIVLKRCYHVGIATATDAGLMVPVVRDCDHKSLLAIAIDIDRLAISTRAGKARPEELSGSTFTITSLGAMGGLLATPILNFPEVAILGIHRIKPRAVVRDGQIVIGDVMLLSLSFDHRVVDGHIGAAFAYEVIAYLEEPDRLMLD